MEGILLINKPKGITSHDVVNKIRKIAKTKKVGHTGTLDPMATGVLPVLIGDATKVSKYLIEHDKSYKVTIEFGKKTETADLEGKIIKEDKLFTLSDYSQEQIENIIKLFIGKIQQVPPIYSAIKVNGKKLYEYAVKGQEVEVKSREIEIYSIELLKINSQYNQIELLVSCSKGTYIRTLCEDIAEKMNTIGFMRELQRIKVDEFNIEDTITIEDLEENPVNLYDNLISIEKVFKNKPQLVLRNKGIELFLNGVQLTYNLDDDVYRIYNEDSKFIGLGTVKDKLLKRDVIIKNN